MRAVIYMRIGNPDQVSAQHPEGALTGQRRSVGRDRSKDVCAGNNIPSLQEFLQEIKGYYRYSNLTIIHHQFCRGLAIINRTPHEVMRVSAIFTQKK